jgi:hypothetical protein
LSSVFTNEYLDTLKDKADPVLDDLVHEAAKQLDGIKTIIALFNRTINSPRLTCKELERMQAENLITAEIVDFFRHHDSVPARPWIEPALLHAGGEFYRDRGVLGFLTLACASLLACYCWSDEAYLLGCTGRLERKDEVPRRLPETAKFVLDVATKKAFSPEGIAIHASHKVRLMHSILRFLIISKQAAIAEGHDSISEREQLSRETEVVFGHNWTNERGAPISQELMIGTLLTFHYVVLRGFDDMGVQVSDEEKEAYLQRWNVVGYLLGIDERVLASLNTMEDAKTMFDLIMERNRNSSGDGPILESALLDYMQTNIIDRVMGGAANPLIVIPRILTRQLSGKETSRAISLKLGFIGTILKYPVWWGTKLVGHLSNLPWARKQTNKLMGYITKTVWNWRISSDEDTEKGGLAPVGDGSRDGITLHPSLAKLWKISE